MIVWPGLRRSMGTRAGIPIANRAAHFDASLGITSSGGFASAWADQSGNGRNLLQATGANQPIHLPFTGTKYGWLPGVAGNYFSTPDSVAASVTGDIDIDVCVAPDDWTPVDYHNFISKWVGATYDYTFQFDTTGGKLLFAGSSGGFAGISSVGTGFTDRSTHWVRVTRIASTGLIKFYTSEDGAAWAQLGSDVAGADGAITDSAVAVGVGGNSSGPTSFPGKMYRARIYNGIRESGGTLAVDFDPSRWTSGTTFPAATGETWTINSTGSKPAQIVDRPSLLFDGAAHYMKTATFPLSQPATLYLVVKQISWFINDVILDGFDISNRWLLFQNDTTPEVRLDVASQVGQNQNLAIGSTGIISTVVNGASSLIAINNGTPVTGNSGVGSAAGITLGAAFPGGSNSNIQSYELLAYNTAHDAATRANVIRALMNKHGVS